jgi:nitrogen fixation protein FixH
MTRPTPSAAFTGKHMLAIMLAFFSVIIAVNVTMATFAGSSWTGFVVKNSYIASQEFNDKVAAARAQQALGWSAALAIEDGMARVELRDADGAPIDVSTATLELRNPATDSADRIIAMAPAGSAHAGPVDIADGVWVAAIRLTTLDGRDFMDTRRILMREGNAR